MHLKSDAADSFAANSSRLAKGCSARPGFLRDVLRLLRVLFSADGFHYPDMATPVKPNLDN